MFSQFILPDIPWSVFWVFIGIGVIIQGISKSGFAGGANILSLPLMTLVMPVDKVAAILLPLLVLCDLNAAYIHRHNKVWKKVFEIYFPSIIGIILGAAVWWWIGREGIHTYEGWIKQFVGILAILLALYIIGRDTTLHWVEHSSFIPHMAIPFGLVAGFTSAIAHAAGPVVSLFIFAHNYGKALFVGTVAWTFVFINITKLPFYAAVGLFNKDIFIFDLFLIWLVPLGSWLGHWLHHRVSEKTFNRIILVLTLLAAIQLLFNINLVQQFFQYLWKSGINT